MKEQLEKNTGKFETLETKRLQEIFTKLPDTDLNYWKTFYTKDLDSKSEYLQKRAGRLLGLIEEAEKIILTPEEPKKIENETIETVVEKIPQVEEKKEMKLLHQLWRKFHKLLRYRVQKNRKHQKRKW